MTQRIKKRKKRCPEKKNPNRDEVLGFQGNHIIYTSLGRKKNLEDRLGDKVEENDQERRRDSPWGGAA